MYIKTILFTEYFIKGRVIIKFLFLIVLSIVWDWDFKTVLCRVCFYQTLQYLIIKMEKWSKNNRSKMFLLHRFSNVFGSFFNVLSRYWVIFWTFLHRFSNVFGSFFCIILLSELKFDKVQHVLRKKNCKTFALLTLGQI